MVSISAGQMIAKLLSVRQSFDETGRFINKSILICWKVISPLRLNRNEIKLHGWLQTSTTGSKQGEGWEPSRIKKTTERSPWVCSRNTRLGLATSWWGWNISLWYLKEDIWLKNRVHTLFSHSKYFFPPSLLPKPAMATLSCSRSPSALLPPCKFCLLKSFHEILS